MRTIIFFLFLTICTPVISKGYDVFGIGLFDIKFDGSATNQATDFRYERRFDNTLFEIGPESYEFFNLKPFAGFEITSESATYFLAGVYLEDNIGTLFTGDTSNFVFLPSFGAGYYNDGDGKQLGSEIEFRTTFEISYQLKNENRIGLSFGHISNANIGDKNPGVEILSLSYQVAY
jgi:hypothetical protein